MTRKEFLSTYAHYKIVEQYKNDFDGGILIEVYDDRLSLLTPALPVFRHFISGFDLDKLLVDYETAVMTAILNWLKEVKL